MDPISTAASVLGVIDKMRTLYEMMKENEGQHVTLVNRLLVLTPPLRQIIEGQRVVKSPEQLQALGNLAAQVNKADDLVTKFGQKTAFRKLDRFLKHNKWSKEFASINVTLTQACTDLQFTMQAKAEERRAQDMHDQTLAFQELIAEVTRDMHEDNEATEENLRQLQEQVAEQHRAVIEAIFHTNGYAPLNADELQALEIQQREHFASLSLAVGHVAEQVGHVAEQVDKMIEMFDAHRRSAAQEALRKQRLGEIHAIKSASEVTMQRFVGSGGQGVVWEGKFKRQPVAIKIIKNTKSPGLRLPHLIKESIENELMLMQAAAGQCVLKVWGYLHDMLETWVVLELALGSLDAILDDVAAFPTLPLSLSVAWLMDVSSAVEHLHERGIRHRDIKAQNMLLFKVVGSRLVAKIGDFGLAKAAVTASATSGGGGGTDVFCSPEYLRGERFTFACDVYSVGMTGVQILNRRTPRLARDKPAAAQVVQAVADAAEGAAGVHQVLLHLLQGAVSVDPAARPHARDLAAQLEQLLQRRLGGDPRDGSRSSDYKAVEDIEKRFEENREAAIQAAILAKNTSSGSGSGSTTNATTTSSTSGSRSAEDLAAISELEKWLRSAAKIQKNARRYAEQLYDHNGDIPSKVAAKVKRSASWLVDVAGLYDEDDVEAIVEALQSVGLIQSAMLPMVSASASAPALGKAEEEREMERERQQQLQREREREHEEKMRREAEAAAKAEAERQAQAKAQQEHEEKMRREAEAAAKAEAEAEARAEREAFELFQRQALLASVPHLAKYRRSYTEAQIAANRAKVAPEGTGEAMYAAAEKGEAAGLLNLVEPWFAHPVLNDYIGGYGRNLTPLHIASCNGHIECVRVLAAQPGIELNKGNRDIQATALAYASKCGHVDIVELLCSLPGIDCNKANTYGYTPHSDACNVYSGPDSEVRAKKIRAILEANAVGEARAKADVEAEAQAQAEAVDPLAKYRRSYTEAQIAANRAKDLKTSWGLLAQDRGKVGEAIYAAAEDGEVAKLLKLVEPWFSHPVINDYSGNYGSLTPLLGASSNGHIECVRVLVAQPGIELNKGTLELQSTALLYASRYGHIDIVELLCSLPGIDCNKANTDSKTPHSVACEGYSGSDKEERARKIRAILEANAVAEARAKGEVKAEAEVAAVDPLAKYRRSYTEAQIAANRAKVAPEGTGEAMYAAAEKGEAAELLKLVESWFAHPVLNDYSCKYGNLTPLIRASSSGRIECVRVLVAQPGIELNKGSRVNQATALLYASYWGCVNIVELLCSLPGIECNKADANGETPHSHACRVYSGSDKEERSKKIRAILEAQGASR